MDQLETFSQQLDKIGKSDKIIGFDKIEKLFTTASEQAANNKNVAGAAGSFSGYLFELTTLADALDRFPNVDYFEFSRLVRKPDLTTDLVKESQQDVFAWVAHSAGFALEAKGGEVVDNDKQAFVKKLFAAHKAGVEEFVLVRPTGSSFNVDLVKKWIKGNLELSDELTGTTKVLSKEADAEALIKMFNPQILYVDKVF